MASINTVCGHPHFLVSWLENPLIFDSWIFFHNVGGFRAFGINFV